MKCLIVCGVLVHIILLMAAFDIYFVSPILHGMKPHRPKGPPPSKRIVLFVADGLRAQSIFGHHMSRTAPFLK